MSSDQPYTPDDDEVRESFVIGQTRDGYGADWDDLIPGAREEFDRFLARVRRDAAREALDGLAAESRERIVNRETTWGHGHSIASAAEFYRDTHYPEETPATEQQTDRERRAMWRQIATDAGDDPYANTLHPDEVLALLDALDQAEAERDQWREMWRQRGIKHLKAEARVRAVQDVLDAVEGDYESHGAHRLGVVRRIRLALEG